MMLFVFGTDSLNQVEKLQQLYELYYIDLIRYVWCYVRSFETAEDLVHDVYVRISLHLDQVPEPGTKKALAYLLKTAKRVCITYFSEHEPIVDYAEYAEFLSNNTDPIWDELTVHELRDKFNSFLDSLEEPNRSLFIYGIVQKRPYKEIAEELNISAGAVANRILRLRGRFQKYLDE